MVTTLPRGSHSQPDGSRRCTLADCLPSAANFASTGLDLTRLLLTDSRQTTCEKKESRKNRPAERANLASYCGQHTILWGLDPDKRAIKVIRVIFDLRCRIRSHLRTAGCFSLDGNPCAIRGLPVALHQLISRTFGGCMSRVLVHILQKLQSIFIMMPESASSPDTKPTRLGVNPRRTHVPEPERKRVRTA